MSAPAGNENAPENTYIAPFVDIPEGYTPPKTKEELDRRLPVNRTPMEKQHRSSDEIASWLTTVVSESFSFDSKNYDEVTKEVSKYYIPYSYEQYIGFLEKGAVEETIRQNDLSLHNYVQDKPFLINKGSLEGRYRWLFEVPVMLNYMRRNLRAYQGQEPKNREIIVKIQVGRYSGANREGILVESMNVRTK
jgi:hypothetical protein